MAWFSGKVSKGNFPDFSEAVSKLSESVKSIEKNFDSALGIEEKSDAIGDEGEGSEIRPLATGGKALFEPLIPVETSKMSYSLKSTSTVGHNDAESAVESSENPYPLEPTSPSRGKQGENENLVNRAREQTLQGAEAKDGLKHAEEEAGSGEKIKERSEEPEDNATADGSKAEGINGGSGEKIEDTRKEPKESATTDHSEAEVTNGGSGERIKDTSEEPKHDATADHVDSEVVSPSIPVEVSEQISKKDEQGEPAHNLQKEGQKNHFLLYWSQYI